MNIDPIVLKSFIQAQVDAGIPKDSIEKSASIVLGNAILSDPAVERGFMSVIKSANVSVTSLSPLVVAEIIKQTTLKHGL